MEKPAGYSSLRRVGDLKHSLRTVDHDGWILLDGRKITKAAYPRFFEALALTGASVTLPDAKDLLLLGAGGRLQPLQTGGANEIALKAENLPAHKHAVDKVTTAATTSQNALLTGIGLAPITKPPTTTVVSGTAETGASGEGKPFKVEPRAIGANVFVYVGQPL